MDEETVKHRKVEKCAQSHVASKGWRKNLNSYSVFLVTIYIAHLTRQSQTKPKAPTHPPPKKTPPKTNQK